MTPIPLALATLLLAAPTTTPTASPAPHPMTAAESAAEPVASVYRRTPQGELRLFTIKPTGWAAGDRRPGVVFFHGGGWNGGSPEQFFEFGRWLADRGMVVVSAEYRLARRHGTTPFEAVEDAFAAFRFVRGHANEFGIDPDRLAAGGGSAGGHLAAALATLDSEKMGAGDPAVDPRPDALVLLNPVYDNGPDGYAFGRIDGRAGDFSPLHNLNADMPPTIVMLGDRDDLIPVATAEAFQRGQQLLGVRSDLVIFPGATHGFFNFDRGPDDYGKVRRLMDEFFVSLDWLDSRP